MNKTRAGKFLKLATDINLISRRLCLGNTVTDCIYYSLLAGLTEDLGRSFCISLLWFHLRIRGSNSISSFVFHRNGRLANVKKYGHLHGNQAGLASVFTFNLN